MWRINADKIRKNPLHPRNPRSIAAIAPCTMLQIAATPYELRFRKPAPTSRGLLTTRPIWFVRAWRTDAPALVGWGECGPIAGLSRDDAGAFGDVIAAFCARFNAAGFTTIADALHMLEAEVATSPSLVFGVEMALRDLANGARRRWWDTPFARGETSLPTHGLIWMDDVDGILRQIEDKIAAGFGVIKMKIGALPFDQELALLRQVRAAHPSIELRLDANGAFSAADALDVLDSLADLDIAFVEQPVKPGAWGVLADLCRHSPAPIALDEELIPICSAEERRALLNTVRPQYVIIKPALLGGFAASAAWIADAEARSIRWIINSLLESNVGLNAICQWTSAIGDCRQGRDCVHGLGTGGLFSNNIASPLTLRGSQLAMSLDCGWEMPQ